MRRLATITAVTLAVAVVVAGAALGARNNLTSTGPPFGAGPGAGGANPHDAGEGTCDVDGLEVGWSVEYGGGSYEVTTTDIGDIASTCAGAELSVLLYSAAGDTTPLAGGTVTVPAGGGSISVPVEVDPRAEDINHVKVVLDGGELPIPDECRGMKLDKVLIGTVGNDNGEPGQNAMLVGSPFNDLIYGIAGSNVIRGIEGHDCLVAGRDDDIVNGDAGNDVIVVEVGENTVYGGPGGDTIYVKSDGNTVSGGGGNNTIHIDGNNNTVNGGGGSSRCTDNGTGNVITACRVTGP